MSESTGLANNLGKMLEDYVGWAKAGNVGPTQDDKDNLVNAICVSLQDVLEEKKDLDFVIKGKTSGRKNSIKMNYNTNNIEMEAFGKKYVISAEEIKSLDDLKPADCFFESKNGTGRWAYVYVVSPEGSHLAKKCLDYLREELPKKEQ